MKVQLYHAIEPSFGFPSEARPDPVWPEGFQHVADIELPDDGVDIAESLETVFHLTNHINKGWNNNPLSPVKCLVQKPRSTSVGDMVVVDNVRYLCDVIGWKEVAPATT